MKTNIGIENAIKWKTIWIFMLLCVQSMREIIEFFYNLIWRSFELYDEYFIGNKKVKLD